MAQLNSLLVTGDARFLNKIKGSTSSDIFTNTSSATNMPVHSYYYDSKNGEMYIKLDPNDLGDTSRLWITMYTADETAVSFEASVSLIDQPMDGSYAITSSLWVPAWDFIYKNGVTNTIRINFDYIYTLHSYVRKIISSSNAYSTLQDYYDDMGGAFYIYVTK